ncbi:MAG: hypothetical protein CMJ76_08215 [Planctomycetaceae bacterium]|nr:hypothetical protein [Planctomycetaceae bacterium]|tara:strand:- start:290 stop:535 length:246 start_codon:yes stop_codon:yes gene_type:complete
MKHGAFELLYRSYQRMRFGMFPVFLFLLFIGTSQLQAEENPAERIGWHANLEKGLALAKQTNRPVFLVSGAPACLGVPGIW